MSKVKNISKVVTGNQTDDKVSKSVPSTTPPPEAPSSKDNLFQGFNKYLSTSYSSQYDSLSKTEQNLVGINEQIQQIEDLLKPISKIERKRGVESNLTPAERKFLKSALQKLKTQRTIENENWSVQYKSHTESTEDEIKKAKNDRFVELGRSGYYVRKYKGTIVSKIKILLDQVLEKNPATLALFRRNLTASRGAKTNSLILSFFKENEDNPFLSTFYTAHKDLNDKYNQLIKELVREWGGKSRKHHSFKDSDLAITVEK